MATGKSCLWEMAGAGLTGSGRIYLCEIFFEIRVAHLRFLRLRGGGTEVPAVLPGIRGFFGIAAWDIL